MTGKNKYLKRICCLFVAGVLTVSGCGKDAGSGADGAAEENIELLDPVSVSTGSAVVERRDIYDYKIYSAICCPPVVECETTTDFRFKSYDKVPGERVEIGDVLTGGDTTDIDDQIESAKDAIEQLKESHTESIEPLKEAVSDAEKLCTSIQASLDELKTGEPSEDSEDHEPWKAQYDTLTTDSLYAELSKDRAEEKVKENDDLYKLDLERAEERLEELYASRKKSGLVSDVEGTEIALRLNNRGNYVTGYYRGEWIGKNTVITAVGDTDKKELRCDYMAACGEDSCSGT